MSTKMLQSYVILRSASLDLTGRARDRFSDDSGEMGSYLILAAGLVVAAVAVVAALSGWFTTKATAITSN